MFLLDIPERGDAASLTEKLDCVTALWPRGGSWGKHGVGGSRAPVSSAAARSTGLWFFSQQHSAQQQQDDTTTFLFGEGEAIQEYLTDLLPFGRTHIWLSGSHRFPSA